MNFISEILLFPFRIIGWMLKLVITIPLMIPAMLFGELMKPQKKNRYGKY